MWRCASWLECIGGTQKRVCTDNNKCDTDEGKPSETQKCILPESEEEQPVVKVTKGDVIDQIQEGAQKSGMGAISGMAILDFAKQPAVIGLIIMIIIIILGLVVYRKVFRK